MTDDRVEAQNEKAGDNADRADEAPPRRDFGRRRDVQDASNGVGPASSAERELGEHEWQDDQGEPDEIKQHEGAAAVGADLVWKLPDAAEAHRGSDIGENEAGATRPQFALGRHWHGCCSHQNRRPRLLSSNGRAATLPRLRSMRHQNRHRH
jgi:hypothetical protein